MALRRRGIHRLGYVWLGLDDPRLLKTREFYTQELGLLETGYASGHLSFRCWHESYKFSFVANHSETPGLVEIGFQVRDDADLAAFKSRVAAAGVAVSEAEADAVLAGLGRSIAFRVPEGPPIRLFAQMDQLGYVAGFEAPDWVPPKPLRGKAAPFHINHVGVTTPNPERCVGFLSDALGFLVSEKIVDASGKLVSALMFRMSKNVGGQELAIFPGDAVKLHHVAFSKEDASDIIADAYHLRADGVDIDPLGPLRQPYGNTFSVHFKDPCGVRLELCNGGRMTDLHREFQPVVWSTENLRGALSYYDKIKAPEAFFQPCL